MRHYPDLGSAYDWLKQISHAPRPMSNTTQINPDLGSDASSVWNFCARFSRPTSFHGETSCFLRLHQIRITPLYKDDMMYSLQCKASTGFSSVNIFVPLNVCFLCVDIYSKNLRLRTWFFKRDTVTYGPR